MSEREETLEIFFSETEDLLKSAEESLLTLESEPESVSDIEQIFRSVHTMKSGAAMVGFMGISDYAHLLESLLERLRNKKLPVTKNLITALLDAIDFIRSMVDRVARGETEAAPETLKERKGQVRRYLGVEAVSGPEERVERPQTKEPREGPEEFRFFKVDLAFRKDLFYSGQDPILLLIQLSELGEFVQVSADLSELPGLEDFFMYDLYISWQIVIKTNRSEEELQDVFMFVADDNDIHVEDITKRYREGIDVELAEKRLGEVLVERSGITEEALTDALNKQKMLGEILVEDGKIEPEDLNKAVALQKESRAVYRKTTIRVNVEKVDSLVNLGEEIGIGLSRAQALLERYATPGQLEIVEEIDNLLKVNREFQERVARVRMFPLEGSFRRFQRMARDLASQQDKQIKVVLSGLDTELDKEVIEHFTDPLKHLVRNCVDHGIEAPEERLAKGKPSTAVLTIKAYQRGGRIFVEIGEDGRGIDVAALEKKALKEGWISPGQVATSEAILGLLFKPGFSTTSDVTEISGRGIGMDVVKTQLDELGGTIEIRTEKDKGTTFVLCLPLTFALMEVLHIVVEGSSYLVPVQAVVGTERFDRSLVKPFGAEQRVYPLRGDYLPLVDITRLLDTGQPTANGNTAVVVFVDTGRKAFGIPAEELLEPQQIIVKSLETNYRSVKGLAGATILGDGSVSLVLDLLGLEEMFFKHVLKGDADYEGKKGGPPG
ncbi:MAG: chemotaxis protein CheA [Thermodesulfobacteriota bacterium]|nr:chemotaxis protein CheA [Thermodesulfobacteriota bacterium]